MNAFDGCCAIDRYLVTLCAAIHFLFYLALVFYLSYNHLAALDDADHDDVLFYNNVPWLSQGAVMERFVALIWKKIKLEDRITNFRVLL